MITEDALQYMDNQGLAKSVLHSLNNYPKKEFADLAEWNVHLKELKSVNHRHIKMATEGALIGSLLYHGLPKNLVKEDLSQHPERTWATVQGYFHHSQKKHAENWAFRSGITSWIVSPKATTSLPFKKSSLSMQTLLNVSYSLLISGFTKKTIDFNLFRWAFTGGSDLFSNSVGDGCGYICTNPSVPAYLRSGTKKVF